MVNIPTDRKKPTRAQLWAIIDELQEEAGQTAPTAEAEGPQTPGLM